MRQVYEFLQKCPEFYLLTVDGDRPEGRPFKTLMEYEGCLFFSTTNTKAVYHQLKANPFIQILGKKEKGMDWIRISAMAHECSESWIKEEMLEVSPRCKLLFSSAQDPTLAVFRISDAYVEYN
jgi:uncharacterized pyridoxamine 5'-phosphate oxidase family protein